MAYRFGPRKDGITPDFVVSTDKEGKLYDYNMILGCILHDYPAIASFEIKKSAKKAISKQAQKNQEC